MSNRILTPPSVLAIPRIKSVLSFAPKAGVFSMSVPQMLRTYETASTTIPMGTEPASQWISTTMMQVRSE
jgi:hypothetical protein